MDHDWDEWLKKPANRKFHESLNTVQRQMLKQSLGETYEEGYEEGVRDATCAAKDREEGRLR